MAKKAKATVGNFSSTGPTEREGDRMRTPSIDAERYTIYDSLGQGWQVVTESAYPKVTTDHPTIESLRERVAELREEGSERDIGVTYRKVLDHSGWSEATLARPYDQEETLPACGHAMAQWGIPISREALADRSNRFLSIPHCHADSWGQDHLGKVNATAMFELEGPEFDGLGYIGDCLALDLDAEACPAIVEAIQALESYPVVDEEALSEYEFEEDCAQWEEWGESETLVALGKLLPLVHSDCIEILPHKREMDGEAITEFQSALWDTAREQGRSSDADAGDTAMRFLGERLKPHELTAAKETLVVDLLDMGALVPDDIKKEDLPDILAILAERKAHKGTPSLPFKGAE